MAKYQTLMAIKRDGKRIPAGSFLTNLKKDELAELKALKAVQFVPPAEEDEADDDAAKKGGTPSAGGKGGAAA